MTPARSGALRIVVGSYDFKVHCVDAATGKAAWTFETSNYVNGTPAIPYMLERRLQVLHQRLPDLFKRVEFLEKKME